MASHRKVLTILALGFFVLTIALFIPPTIDAQGNEVRDSVLITEGDTRPIDSLVELTLDDVNQPEDYVNVTITDTETLATATITNLSVDETKTASPDGERVEVTLESIESGNTAILTASFSRTYGWEPTAVVFANNLDTMLALVAVLMILASVLMVVRP